MIVVRIMAGLGNQMLQYAIGRQLSIKNDTPLYLDLSWFDGYDNPEHPRVFGLQRFHTKYQPVDLHKWIWKLRYTDHLKPVNPFKLKNVKEKDYAVYDPAILDAGDNILLEGFFSCYKYFESIRDTLLAEFTPVEPLNDENAACLQRIKNSNSVSVHIRRGDYAHTEFHGLLEQSYYTNAIEYLAKKVGGIRLFVFSDEPVWVSQNMQFEHPYELVSFNKDEKNYFDMELMKNCRHNIIANSSFSWWAAWLNKNPEKIVIAPKLWFNEGRAPGALVPAEWYQL